MKLSIGQCGHCKTWPWIEGEMPPCDDSFCTFPYWELVREVNIEMDDPATTVYGRLLYRHMEEARKDFDSDDRHRIYALIDAFEAEFPEQCAVWKERYSSKEQK